MENQVEVVVTDGFSEQPTTARDEQRDAADYGSNPQCVPI